MINFYAQSESDGIQFDHYFNADSFDKAQKIAKKHGWALIGQEDVADEICAIVELMMVKPERVH